MQCVLIVDDNVVNLSLSTFLVKSAGYAVIAAADAEQGIKMAREQVPDLILMDIQLPGMDGLEAIGVLKEDPTTRGIPIIALTALAMKGDEARIRASGCDGYIAKPMRYQKFLAAIAMVLESR
ncbi:MAG: response regulator receiver [Gemmatimonadetes bacterium]|jgi:two-component system cell cycle response regulator DivK|nr:response regulator receiver [Gemmatimonadota bacterium]